MTMPKLAGALLIASLSLPVGRLPAAESAGPPVVILKLDDVRAFKADRVVHPNWPRIAAFIETNGLHAAFGIIGASLETNNPAYFDWLKAQQAKGVIEFWCHGYRERTDADKTGEFDQGTFEEQMAVFERCEKLAVEKLGFPLPAFGPHWSGTTEATEQALEAVPEHRIWLYGPEHPKFYHKLSLPRVMGLEDPIFVPDFEKFKATYERVGARQKFLVLQGHPPAWYTPERWSGFTNIVMFLKSKGCTFMTPSGYEKSLAPAK